MDACLLDVCPAFLYIIFVLEKVVDISYQDGILIFKI